MLYFFARLTATAKDTVAPTIGLLPIPMVLHQKSKHSKVIEEIKDYLSFA